MSFWYKKSLCPSLNRNRIINESSIKSNEKGCIIHIARWTKFDKPNKKNEATKWMKTTNFWSGNKTPLGYNFLYLAISDRCGTFYALI